MKNNLRIMTIFSGVIGALVGFIGGPVQILVLWSAIGLGIGYFSKTLRQAIIDGAVYGFVVSFTFLLRGYNGVDPVGFKLLSFFAALSFFGALCGAILGYAGELFYLLLRKKHLIK
jgi:hypothetical protein